jgi:dienelactone hydrolase
MVKPPIVGDFLRVGRGRHALALFALITSAHAAEPLAWLPANLPALPADGPVLCVRDYLTEAQGKAVLDAAVAKFSTQEKWDAYASLLRERVLQGAGLAPWPRRTALNPIVHSRREYDGYSVENVAFESIPGYFVGGNLYRPLKAKGLRPAILTTHGHTGPLTSAESWSKHGRFTDTVQLRSATLARMGAVVLAIEMFGYGDSTEQLGREAHRTTAAMPMQIWNARRALDFLESLPGVDRHRIGVTGESGGGTQTFLLAALDSRVAVSAPVVMVSAYFFGGCPCESGRPIHRSADHFASNAMLAALAAPRPQGVVSVGGDWSKNTPQVEFPFLRHVYGLSGAEKNLTNDHFPTEGHNFGPSKRQAVYRLMHRRLGLDGAVVRDAHGQIDESAVTIEPADALRTWTAARPLPAHALRSVDAVLETLQQLQQP